MCCAGIGKTTLAHEICIRWARDGFLSEEFDAIVLIPLRCVHQRSLEEVLVEFTGEEDYQQLKKAAGHRSLIILEGLDEMAADRQKSDRFFIRMVRDCAVLEKSTILLTSRPHACGKLNPDRQVEVVGFGAAQIEEFVNNSFPYDKDSVSELLKQLNDYPHIKSMCYVPLNIVMITDIFKCRQKKLPSTLTELYKLFLVTTLMRHMDKKEDDKYTTSSGIALTAADSEHLKKMLPGIPINAIGTVYLLCRLSFCGFFDWCVDMQEDKYGRKKKWKDPKITFTMQDLIKCGIDVTSEQDCVGLLKATHIHEVPTDTSSYNFSHLSLQEFLCALHISLLPEQEQLQLLKNYFRNFNNVFMFLCGLTGLKCNEMYHHIHSKLMSETYDGDPNVIPAVRCVHESKYVQSTVPFTLDMSGNHVQPYDCYCVSYVLSHFAVSQVKMEGCWMGDTGVEVLEKHYSNDDTLLEVLDLSDNDLTAVGMVHVMKIVKTSEPLTEQLYVSAVIITGMLRELDVSFNGIGDNEILLLTEELQTSKKLTKLNLTLCTCELSVKGTVLYKMY